MQRSLHLPREAVFMDDGRHVQPTYVAGIMRQFERAFVKSPAASGAVPMPMQRMAPAVNSMCAL